MRMEITIQAERPDSSDALALIGELEAELEPLYPPESQHGYSVEQLIAAGVAFFVVRVNGEAAGCGGIQFYPDYGELKRMYVRPAFRGMGLAGRLYRPSNQLCSGTPVPPAPAGDRYFARCGHPVLRKGRFLPDWPFWPVHR